MANSLKQELKGKRVVVKDGIYRAGPTEEDRTFLCEDGFGCSSFTRGTAIFGRFMKSGVKCRIEGNEVEKLANEEGLEN